MNTNIFIPTKINEGFKVNYEKKPHGKAGEMKIFQMKSMIMSQWKDLY